MILTLLILTTRDLTSSDLSGRWRSGVGTLASSLFITDESCNNIVDTDEWSVSAQFTSESLTPNTDLEKRSRQYLCLAIFRQISGPRSGESWVIGDSWWHQSTKIKCSRLRLWVWRCTDEDEVMFGCCQGVHFIYLHLLLLHGAWATTWLIGQERGNEIVIINAPATMIEPRQL